jgi:hypothetical protein
MAALLALGILLQPLAEAWVLGTGLPRNSGAGQSLDLWFNRRMDRDGQLDIGAWTRAFHARNAAVLRGDGPQWQSLGPHNVGGRTLCLAFHPEDPEVIYAGSASGGLWVTRTAGKGAQAWERLDIGHPVLGVSSILIDPQDPQRVWIGTGEMYSNGKVRPGTINRFTRGTYGIGILRSTDGGQTWQPSLDWSYGQMRGVQQLAMNPQRRESLWAATSEGLYRSWDGGDSWQLAFQVPMVTDIYQHPQDTTLVLITAGSYFTQNAGLYRSLNGGGNFAKVTNGFPSNYTGKAMLAGDPSDPDLIYAYVADVLKGRGLFRSLNGGGSWSLVNATDVSLWQGWYSHDLAVNPANGQQVLVAGVDVFRSFNGGGLLIQTGIWEAGAMGKVPAGGPEGPPYYVHADVHGVYFHPSKPDEAWFATDGGIFMSPDAGLNFEGRNGGYQTQQFYARFSSSQQDPHFAVGGLQDNATVIYEGDKEWIKVIGGDGMCTAIHPLNDQLLMASLPNMVPYRSLNRGQDFQKSDLPFLPQESRPFNGAFTLDPEFPPRVLAGAQRLYRSEQFAQPGTWIPLQDAALDGDNVITGIAIGEDNPNRVLVITASDPILAPGGNTGKMLLSTQGGQGMAWVAAQGLPARYATSAAFHPMSSDTVMATFSGFGGPHLYRSVNGGLHWQPWGQGLPDLPTNVVVFDPFQPRHLYLGNDLGVWFSEDGGAYWSPFGQGLPEACMVMDLSIAKAGKVIRAATHGLGAYEAPLHSQAVSVQQPDRPRVGLVRTIYPNPARDHIWLDGLNPALSAAVLSLWDLQGRRVAELRLPWGITAFRWDLPVLAPGCYLLRIGSEGNREDHRVLLGW